MTTRIEGVAQACRIGHGHIHYMKPLSDVDSRKLFFRRTFGTEDTCPSQFTQVSSEILKKCGGLPLAVVTMASSLADKPKEHWEYIQRSMVTESAANSLDDMIHILDLSYKHLPHHLKSCFLYLGIYPEDYEIRKDHLIDLWVAERIVTSKNPRQDVRDVAESCFNELVNRNMIQSESYHYRVHDMMLDLIIKRCREDNFVSVVHSAQVVVERQDRVHRLTVSVSGGAEDDTILQVATNCCRSQVRSLVAFGTSKWMPPFSELKSLRVLYLEFPEDLMRMDLTGVGQLSMLRYLKIEPRSWWTRSECSVVLPSEIWRLQHLERLEIRSIPVCITPSEGSMSEKSLRTLRSFLLAGFMSENIKGELNKLEVLNLYCCRNDYMPRPTVFFEGKRRYGFTDDDDTPKTTWMDAQFFLTSECVAIGADAQSSLSPPFHDLEVLHLDGLIFLRVPRRIGGLQKLRELRIGAKQMHREDISMIGTLPCLIKLWLWIPGVPTGRMVIGGATGFDALQKFEFKCDVASYLTFEDGAMPSLRKIAFELDYVKWDDTTPLGLQYLSNLEEFSVTASGDDRDPGMKGTEMCDAFETTYDTLRGRARGLRSFCFNGTAAHW